MTDLQRGQLAGQARQAFAAGQHGRARELAERALRKNRRDVTALELLGLLALDEGDFETAEKHLRRCAALRPDELQFQYHLGRLLADRGRTEEALAQYERVLQARPDHAAALLSMAVSLERVGRWDRARPLLERLLEMPEATPATSGMYARVLMGLGRTADAADHLGRRLEETSLAPRHRQSLLYVLGKALDKLGEYDRAFEACREANEIDKRPFDPAAYAAVVDAQIRVFDRAALTALSRSADRSDLPVIIAGMPRSGTTLVEQILDAHPKAAGAGELAHLPRLIGGFQMRLDSYEPYPDCLEDLTAAMCSRLGREYLGCLRSCAPAADRIVDKTLDNVEHLGLISLLVPGARAVICRRDPRDTGLSCYLNPILPDRFAYVTDLRHLGFVHRQQQRLVRHWLDTLELPMLEVEYEQIVADQEQGSRRLVEFCRLPWDEACLRFHDSGRTVMTLSYDQVSRPMYRSSAGRWKGYEKNLGPLIEELEKSD